MERVEIAVQIPLKAAVMSGKKEYGEATVQPSDKELQSLGFDERRVLLRFVKRSGIDPDQQRRLRIRTAPATWDGVVEAIRRMVANQDQAQRNADETTKEMHSREAQVPTAAAVLRNWCDCSDELCDREVIEHTIPALMEEVQEKVIERCKITSDQIRIVNVDSSEYRRMSVSERTEYSVRAAELLREVSEVMLTVLPADSRVFEIKTSVVRVRQRSRTDGIARRPFTYVAGVFQCAAASPSILFVCAEQPEGEGTVSTPHL